MFQSCLLFFSFSSFFLFLSLHVFVLCFRFVFVFFPWFCVILFCFVCCCFWRFLSRPHLCAFLIGWTSCMVDLNIWLLLFGRCAVSIVWTLALSCLIPSSSIQCFSSFLFLLSGPTCGQWDRLYAGYIKLSVVASDVTSIRSNKVTRREWNGGNGGVSGRQQFVRVDCGLQEWSRTRLAGAVFH